MPSAKTKKRLVREVELMEAAALPPPSDQGARQALSKAEEITKRGGRPVIWHSPMNGYWVTDEALPLTGSVS